MIIEDRGLRFPGILVVVWPEVCSRVLAPGVQPPDRSDLAPTLGLVLLTPRRPPLATGHVGHRVVVVVAWPRRVSHDTSRRPRYIGHANLTPKCDYMGLWMMEASLRKPTVSSGSSQRCSSECMWCRSLCICSAGQCRRTCSTVPSAVLQWVQVAVGARPILCMYVGMEVWCPQRRRER